MKKFSIYIAIFLGIIMSIALSSTSVLAVDFGSWWNGANTWYENGSTTVSVDQTVISGISGLVELVGTAVIAIVTVVLGLKYMLSSAVGRAEVKDNLIGLVVACTFFFGWSTIRGILISGNATGANGLDGTTHLIFFSGGNLQATVKQIFTFALTIAKIVCVVVIAYNGMKYVMAGAEAKAQLKQKTPAMLLGIVLIFCTVQFIQFIVNAVTTSLN